MIERNPGPGTRAGFTIAEVTLIIVVLAVLFALLLPRMNAFLRRGHLRSAMAELTEVHDLARASATRLGRPVELHLDAVRGTFWVESGTSIGGGVWVTLGSVHSRWGGGNRRRQARAGAF